MGLTYPLTVQTMLIIYIYSIIMSLFVYNISLYIYPSSVYQIYETGFPSKTPFMPILTLYLIETPFNAFANRVDPDQAALKELPDQGLFCLLLEIQHI